jgi:hypothetical protein
MKTIHRLAMTDEYIAEAQRRSISQNTLLKLMYQTWWVTWPPRLGMAAFILYCWSTNSEETAAIFALLLALAFIAHWSGRRGLARQNASARQRRPGIPGAAPRGLASARRGACRPIRAGSGDSNCRVLGDIAAFVADGRLWWRWSDGRAEGSVSIGGSGTRRGRRVGVWRAGDHEVFVRGTGE